jgi:iron complex transport system substrate-binding protein
MRLLTTTLAVLFLLTAAVGPSMALSGVSGADTRAMSTQQADCSFSVTLTDATGTEVTVDERPETVTTLGPSAAQTMWEIGGKSQVVGLDQYALYLDGAESRTNVSASGFGYDVEKVVGTEADLVIAANTTPAETVQKLREAGMTVYKTRSATTVEDVEAKTTAIGRLTGNCEGAAETNAWMTANVETAREVTADTEKPRVLVPQGEGYVVGGGTFIDAMVTAAGGENVAADEYQGYPQLSDEVVLELDPEVLVLADWATYLSGQEPYSLTTAGQQNTTVVVNSNYLSQPAPRSVVYTTRNLTEGFHPDAAASAEWTARSEVSLNESTATDEVPTTVDTGSTTTSTDDTAATSTGESTSTDSPGFSVVTALVATLGAALLFRRD